MDINDIIDSHEDIKKLNGIMQIWQEKGANELLPMVFKYRVGIMEDYVNTTAYSSKSEMLRVKDNISGITPRQYLRWRALNQTYMDHRGIEKVELYRGVMGETAEKIIRDIVDNNRQDFLIADNSVGEYTDNINIAKKYCKLVIKVTVSVEDIIVHKDLMPAENKTQRKYLCKGINRKVKDVNLWWKYRYNFDKHTKKFNQSIEDYNE